MGDRVMLYKHPGGPPPPLRINPRVIYSSPSRRGAYAEYITVPTRRIIRVPKELSDKQAATIEPLLQLSMQYVWEILSCPTQLPFLGLDQSVL